MLVKFCGKMTVDARLLQDKDVKELFDSLRNKLNKSNNMMIESDEAISSAFVRCQVRGYSKELITVNNAKRMVKLLICSQLPDDEKEVLEKYAAYCETDWKKLLSKLAEYRNGINFELVEYLPDFCIEHVDFSLSAVDSSTPVLLTFIPTRMKYSAKNMVRFGFEKGYKVDVENEFNTVPDMVTLRELIHIADCELNNRPIAKPISMRKIKLAVEKYCFDNDYYILAYLLKDPSKFVSALKQYSKK